MAEEYLSEAHREFLQLPKAQVILDGNFEDLAFPELGPCDACDRPFQQALLSRDFISEDRASRLEVVNIPGLQCQNSNCELESTSTENHYYSLLKAQGILLARRDFKNAEILTKRLDDDLFSIINREKF